ncbi:MAG: 2-hydroxychromene-2-carboxylate isomerase [Halioglobus sp.]|nr:2-hydroxychromene-2-carboxylate isomerase [Halioglobus sp.]
MTRTVEFYFDVGSPTAYLAHKRLLQLQQPHNAQGHQPEAANFSLRHRPMLLGGVFKATGNQSPVAIPAKGAYMLQHDLPRFARRYGVTLNFNPHFPINTLQLMRGALAAETLGCASLYIDAVFEAIWVDARDMGDATQVAATLDAAGLDAQALLELAQSNVVKTALIDATDAAVARGVFGAPTMFVGDQMFFGQDRLDFVMEALEASVEAQPGHR